MDAIRAKMDAIKDKIDKADETAESTMLEKDAATKRLHDIEMHLEETQRHKHSIEFRLRSSKQHLQLVTDKLAKAQGNDQSHVEATEAFERVGEVHDTRINNLQQKINVEKRKFSEGLIILEEAKRKVDVLKRDLVIIKKKGDDREKRITVLEGQLSNDDGLTNAIETKNINNLDKEYEMETAVEALKEKIQHSQDRIDVAEREIPLLQHRIEIVKRETRQTKDKTAHLHNELALAAEAMLELEM